MDRIEAVRNVVDGILRDMPDGEERKFAYIHLYGVAQAAALIAKKRGENVELAVAAAMLHDIYSYKSAYTADHAHKGAVIARAILNELKVFSIEEINLICSAIHRHSDKVTIDSPFDEVLKDADAMQHILYNPLFAIRDQELERFYHLKAEFGLV